MLTASQIESEWNEAQVMGFAPLFQASAERYGLPPELLAGIASRETNMGRTASAEWTGDGGHGRGLMQIDDRAHPAFVAGHSNDDHAANIDYAAALLAGHVQHFGDWTSALAAYNAGRGAVNRALAADRDPDSVTTGGNYASDVLTRSADFRRYFSNPIVDLVKGLFNQPSGWPFASAFSDVGARVGFGPDTPLPDLSDPRLTDGPITPRVGYRDSDGSVQVPASALTSLDALRAQLTRPIVEGGPSWGTVALAAGLGVIAARSLT